MKRLIFKKGIYTINIPFYINDIYPWQVQISRQLDMCKKEYKVRKSAKWGFEITENGAMIKCYKNKK